MLCPAVGVPVPCQMPSRLHRVCGVPCGQSCRPHQRASAASRWTSAGNQCSSCAAMTHAVHQFAQVRTLVSGQGVSGMPQVMKMNTRTADLSDGGQPDTTVEVAVPHRRTHRAGEHEGLVISRHEAFEMLAQVSPDDVGEGHGAPACHGLGRTERRPAAELLDQLPVDPDRAQLQVDVACYHGDFDWGGIRIADAVRQRVARDSRTGSRGGTTGTLMRPRQRQCWLCRLPRGCPGWPASRSRPPWDPGLAAAMACHDVRIEEELSLDTLLANLA